MKYINMWISILHNWSLHIKRYSQKKKANYRAQICNVCVTLKPCSVEFTNYKHDQWWWIHLCRLWSVNTSWWHIILHRSSSMVLCLDSAHEYYSNRPIILLILYTQLMQEQMLFFNIFPVGYDGNHY